MVLEIGKAAKARFIRFIKKTNIFECGPNGIVVEREHNIITLYATNSRCSEIYAVVTLGTNQEMKKYKCVAIAYSEDIMLLDAGKVLAVVDFAQQKVALSDPDMEVRGRKHWGEDARMPWTPEFNAMFGLPTGEE